MDTIIWRPGDFRRHGSRFEWTNQSVFAPRGEQTEDEFRRMALQEDDAVDVCRTGVRRSFPTFTRREQFGKSPAATRGGVAQREVVAPFPGNFPPSFVKHCQFVNARLTSSASELMIAAKINQDAAGGRRFEFARDTFSFANELVWEYRMDPATGKRTFGRRNPKPEFAHRCFALARVARQFFYHARFAVDQPIATDEIYRQKVRSVLGRHPRTPCSSKEQIIIPGFAGLRELSRAHEKLLKAECGGAWRSYFLRSHWRMAFPFTRAHQRRTAGSLAAALAQHRLPILHLVKFPAMSINHGIVLFGVTETGRSWEFESYDPNNSETSEQLTFDQASQTFFLAENACWPGGALNVSHICRSWFF